MRAGLVLVFSVAIVFHCAAQSDNEPEFEGTPHIEGYNGGYFVARQPGIDVTIYRPDASVEYKGARSQEPSRQHSVWAVDSDGFIAKAYVSIRPEFSSRIDLLGPLGKPVLSIDTGLFVPDHLIFAPDHSIWAMGWMWKHQEGEEINLVRHYSPSGEELLETLPWSQISNYFDPNVAPHGLATNFYVTDDRIGFSTFLPKLGKVTWLEFGTNGNLLDKYDVGDCDEICYSPRAMTSSGSVYAQVWQHRRPAGSAVLDRSTKTWRKITGEPKGGIVGADYENVIFDEDREGWTVLHSVPSGSLRVKPVTAPQAPALEKSALLAEPVSGKP